MSNINNNFKGRMYSEFWQNVRNAEKTSWKVFISYDLFIGIISFLLNYTFSNLLIIILLTMLTTIAISITLNANLWFLRNMYLISRVERVFKPYDIIPLKWKEFKLPFFNREIWTIHMFLYILTSIFLSMFFFVNLDLLSILLILGVILICLVTVFFYAKYLYKQYKRLNEDRYPNYPRE